MTAIYTDVNLDELGGTPARPPSDTTARTAGGPDEGPLSSEEQNPFAGKGELLEEPDGRKVFKAIHDIVMRQEPIAKNDAAADKHWGRVRRNVPFSILNKDEDRAVWTAELPPGITDTASPTPNMADDLCRKIVSQITVDVAKPAPKPATDSEQDRGSADIAKRFLLADGDESGTNDAELFRDCEDTCQTTASAFAHVWTDPQGDGWRPRQIKAHPQAMDANNPLVAFTVDPVTQQQVEVPTTDYVLRYVTGDGGEQGNGQFTEDATQAARQWMPKIIRDVLLPVNVRTVPETADVDSAEGVILLMVGPLSDLMRRVPELRDADDKILMDLVDWRPPRAKVLVPPALRPKLKAADKAKGEGYRKSSVPSDTLVFWYQKYCKIGGQYPDGASIIVSGAREGIVLSKKLLRTDVKKDDGTMAVVLRDIPVSQCKAMLDSEGRNRWGRRPLEMFAPTNEALAQLYGGVLADQDKRVHPNLFVTSTSTVQDWQLTQRTGEPITVLSKDDMPMYEEFADFPAFLPQIIENLSESMRETAGLGATAQVLDSPNAKSGIAKSIEVNQAKVALTPMAQPFFAFVKRYWRIKIQTAIADLTVPQQVEYTGVDTAYKQQWWTGRDFLGVKNIAIQAGTGTMSTTTEKQQIIGYGQQAGWLDPEESAEVGRSTLNDDLGLESNPHENLIGRQIAKYMEGPPEGWEAQYAQVQQAQMAAQAQAQQAAAVGVDPAMLGQPQIPTLWTPFEARPTDEDPIAAKFRYRKLRDFLATSDYSKWTPAWRSTADTAFTQASYNAGVQTMRQKFEASQMQAQQQAAAKQQPGEKSGETNEQPDIPRAA